MLRGFRVTDDHDANERHGVDGDDDGYVDKHCVVGVDA